MELSVTTEQGRVPVAVLHVKGNIDSTSYLEFQSEAESLIAGGVQNLLLDLRAVPYMSSAGLRALNQIYNKLRTHSEDHDSVSKGLAQGTYKSSHLKLLSPGPRVMDTLRMSGFDMFLDIRSDLRQAVDSF